MGTLNIVVIWSIWWLTLFAQALNFKLKQTNVYNSKNMWELQNFGIWQSFHGSKLRIYKKRFYFKTTSSIVTKIRISLLDDYNLWENEIQVDIYSNYDVTPKIQNIRKTVLFQKYCLYSHKNSYTSFRRLQVVRKLNSSRYVQYLWCHTQNKKNYKKQFYFKTTASIVTKNRIRLLDDYKSWENEFQVDTVIMMSHPKYEKTTFKSQLERFTYYGITAADRVAKIFL